MTVMAAPDVVQLVGNVGGFLHELAGQPLIERGLVGGRNLLAGVGRRHEPGIGDHVREDRARPRVEWRAEARLERRALEGVHVVQEGRLGACQRGHDPAGPPAEPPVAIRPQVAGQPADHPALRVGEGADDVLRGPLEPGPRVVRKIASGGRFLMGIAPS